MLVPVTQLIETGDGREVILMAVNMKPSKIVRMGRRLASSSAGRRSEDLKESLELSGESNNPLAALAVDTAKAELLTTLRSFCGHELTSNWRGG